MSTVTYVPSENGTTTITTQVNDTVYVLNSRTATYKHVLHRVRRIAHGMAVTYWKLHETHQRIARSRAEAAQDATDRQRFTLVATTAQP